MAETPASPYHIDQQYADGLLRPVGATLAELEERLTQYVDRLYLGARDRARVEAARDIVAAAHRQMLPLSGQSDAGVSPRNET